MAALNEIESSPRVSERSGLDVEEPSLAQKLLAVRSWLCDSEHGKFETDKMEMEEDKNEKERKCEKQGERMKEEVKEVIKPHANFQVGDIVLVVDTSRPRNSWLIPHTSNM